MTGTGAAILGCAGPHLDPDERAFFRDADPLGFILFGRNLETADQIRALTHDLRAAVGREAPIFIDQEGGRVARLRPPLARDWLPPLDFAALYGDRAAEAFRLRYAIIGAELRALGIDGNCAPMLDVARAETHPFLRNRCYGTDVDRVVALGRAAAEGHLEAGVLPVIKHIPGHGLARLDSHLDLPRITAPADELDAVDFAAFRPFAGMGLGMTAHLVFEAFDPEPATTSPAMIARIREDLGFRGFLMTDDISMEALSGSVAERSRAALAAGCDAVLHCNGDMSEMVAVMGEAASMTEAARARAAAALADRRDARAVDIAALAEKLDGLPQIRPA